MRQMRSDCGRRQAFTLIELLVVIGILAILFALTSAAVMRAFRKGPEAVARADIGQLATSFGAFKNQFPQPGYVPSSFVLYKKLSDYTTGATATAQAKASWTILQQMFGKRLNSAVTIDWNGAGAGVDTHVTLTGDQCLVFFLGGVQSQSPIGCLGFSTDPTNPDPTSANPTAGTSRYGPYFDFKTTRLIKSPKATNSYLSYADPFLPVPGRTQQPYAYFTAGKVMNGYVATDCSNLSVAPYYAPGTTPLYLLPNSFQIISAGPDNVFGPGGSWPPASGYGTPPVVPNGGGGDDMSNFSRTALGQPQT